MTTEQAQTIEKGMEKLMMHRERVFWKSDEKIKGLDLREMYDAKFIDNFILEFSTSLLSTKEPETVGEDWEERYRQMYEGANVWSSKSIDDQISFIRSLLTSKLSEQRREMIERLPKEIEDNLMIDEQESGRVLGYNQALKDAHEALKG